MFQSAKFKNFTILGLILLNVITTLAIDETIFNKPAKQALVFDHAAVFSPEQIESLTYKLNTFNSETSTQIVVLTTNDLLGYDIADFAQRIGAGYGVGQQGFDNGIVIVFKTKTTDSNGQVTIQTGYGIEPLIPDATANQIIENEMVPLFKQGDIYSGINAAVDICISLTKGEFTAKDYGNKKESVVGGLIFLLIFFLVIFGSAFGRSRSAGVNNLGSKSNLPFWIALGLLSGGSGRSGGWNNFSSGSGNFGGGSSFGGFGGGGFGGGGASGSW